MNDIEVEISEELLQKLNALPDRHDERKKPWTKEQDAILMKYWPIKRQQDVANIIGFCTNKCLDRYRELRGEDLQK